MNTIELFVISGELKCGLVDRSYQHIVRSRRQPWHGPQYFEDACELVTCVRKYLKNELVLFCEAIMLTAKDLSTLAPIDSCARALSELLDDIVMLHADEPDGSFTRGIADITKLFEQLVHLMRESLTIINGLSQPPVDLRQLGVLMLSAA
jgi:hypothetical protein